MALRSVLKEDDPDRLARVLETVHTAAPDGPIDIDGMTAIHWAVEYGAYRCLEAMLPSVDMDRRAETEGIDAALLNNDTIIGKVATKLFLGRVRSRRRYRNTTPLGIAARRGDREATRLLLAYGADPDIDDQHRITPLMTAAELGHPAVAAKLIAAGADIHRQDTYGNEPLYYACLCGEPTTIRALLDRGADPFRGNKNGHTPLMAAAGHTDTETLTTMINDIDATRQDTLNVADKDGRRALLSAVSRRRADNARVLIDAGADVSVRTKRGVTILMAAAAEGLLPIVTYLVESARVSLNEKDTAGRDALHHALQQNQRAIVAYLISAGCKPGSEHRNVRTDEPDADPIRIEDLLR